MNKQTPPNRFRESPPKDCTLNMRMTAEQYQKLRRLGGAAWVRVQISNAKESSKSEKSEFEVPRDFKFIEHLRVPTVRIQK